MTSLSIIVPVKDEEESLPQFYKEVTSSLQKLKNPYELIFIDDGSDDMSASIITTLQKKDKHIKFIKFRGNFGKSAALSEGFDTAKNDVIVTIDADLQDDPNEIGSLLNKLEEGYDLVSGWRKKRSDTVAKKISSFLFNRGTVFITGIKLHDFNCGLKVFRKEVTEEVYLHGELHRFIPILAAKQKFKVTEVPVNHRARKFGKSKFGFERSWRGILDLMTTTFISDYSTKPAHFFGRIGLVFFGTGFFIGVYITYIRLSYGNIQHRLPLLLAGILFMVLGVQLLSTGLIAEMISHFNHQKKKYVSSKKL